MTNKTKINLTLSLPSSYKNKALKIIQQLSKGESYFLFKGKRLNRKRSVISIPIGRRFRLVCKDIHGKIIPISVMTHETYNNFIKHSI